MALAFWGGFASGMSESIEKNRKFALLEKERNDAKAQEIRNQVESNKEKQYELSTATRDAFTEINNRILDIKSGKINLTESEAINEINYLNNQKLDTYKKAVDYGMNLEIKDPREVYDMSSEDIGQIGVYTSDDGRYIVNKELGEALDNNSGEIRIGKKGEVERRRVTQNSQGQLVPEKNDNGDFIYESTGEFLQATSDVLKQPIDKKGRQTSLEQDNQAFQDLKSAKATYNSNPTEENLDTLNSKEDIYIKRVHGQGEAKERPEKGSTLKAMSYGKTILEDISKYDYDESFMAELDFTSTDFYNKKGSLKKDETLFNAEIVSFNRNKGLFDVFDRAVKDGSYKSGIIQELQNIAVKFTPEEFTSMLKLDREEIKNRLGLEGQIGDGVAIYLKGLTGTASSQGEFVRTLNNFVGRDMTREDVKQEVFSNFIEKKARDLDVLARSIVKRGLVNTGGEWLARNNKQTKKKDTSVEAIGGKEYETRTVNGQKQYKNPADGKWYK